MAENIDSIDKGFKVLSEQPSNLNEHFPSIKIYAQQCSRIAQLGCSDMLSCWPLLSGLKQSSGKGDKKLVCFDKNSEPENFQNIKRIAKTEGVKMFFVQEDALKLTLQPVDMLVIDTFHAYIQLKTELERHHKSVEKFIAILNTSIDAETSELVRMFYFYDIDKICAELACNHADVCKGLAPAIEDFLASHGDTWKVHKSFDNNNGLVVLQRISIAK
jgi:hypothetical protein